MTNPFTKKKAKSIRRGKTKPKKVLTPKQTTVDGIVGIKLPEPEPTTDPWRAKQLKKRVAQHAASDKQDKTIEGVRVCHVREHDGYWTIEVINGDITYRFDNRHGWLLDLGDSFTEPKPWLKQVIVERWYSELKRQGRSAPHHGIDHFPHADLKKKTEKQSNEAAPTKRGRPKGSKNKSTVGNPFNRKKR